MISKELACGIDDRRNQIAEYNRLNPRWNGIDYVEVVSDTRIIVKLFCDLTSLLDISPSDKPVSVVTDLKPFVVVCNPGVSNLAVANVVYNATNYTVTIDLVLALIPGKYQVELRSGFDIGVGKLDQRYLVAEFEYLDFSLQLLIDPNTKCGCKPEIATSEPEISYTARDFDGFRRLISDRLALTMPEWRETHVPDIGVAITEIMAYVADHLAQYQDAVATEAYLSTARSRISARRHARLIDYDVDEGSNSRAFLYFEVAADVDITPEDLYFITLPADRPEFVETNLMESELRDIPKSRYRAFEIVQPQRESVEEPTLPELKDPLVLLIQIQFIPCPSNSPWFRLVDFIRRRLKQVVEKVLPLEAGIGTAWRYANSLVALSAPHVHMLVDALGVLIAEKNLTKLIDRNLLPVEIQEQIACCHPEWDRPQINRIVLNYLFPEQFKDSKDISTKIRLYESHNQIEIYTWGQKECCLNKGATHATLRDQWVKISRDNCDPCRPKPVGIRNDRDRALKLEIGDLLLFEEIIDPSTGEKLDANPTHRQVVRLTCVQPCIDELTGTPVLEVWWSQEDKLRFTLCVSSRMPKPPCAVLPTVGVARGNILHVDQGLTIADDDLGYVKAVQPKVDCANRSIWDPQPDDIGKYRPRLSESGLAFVNPPDLQKSATAWLAGPKAGERGVPAISLLGIPGKAIQSDSERHKPILTTKQLRAPEGCGACIAYLDNDSSIALQNAISPALGQYFVALQKRAQVASGDAIRFWGKDPVQAIVEGARVAA